MASSSREIEGDKVRLSSVQRKSKIPVRKVTCLNNDSGKRSSFKDEVDKKQRIWRESAKEPVENSRPSRIPIIVGRTNSKTVKEKLLKSVIAVTGKRPLGRDSGINLRETQGRQAANRPTATKHSNPKPAGKESTPVERRMSTRKGTPFDIKQVSKDEKEPLNETPGDKHVQLVDLSSNTCKLQSDHRDDIIGQKEVSGRDYAYLREEVELLRGSLDMCNYREQLLRHEIDALKKGQASKSDVQTLALSCEEGPKKKLEQIEKENSEIVEELQQWVEDGDKENKTLAEIIEKTSDENVKLLAQISVMKKELKALAVENNTLHSELETKSTNLKDLRFQVDTLEAEVSRFKTSELEFKSLRDETSSLIDKLEVQLDAFITESARVISEKDQELNKRNEEKSTSVEQLNELLTALMQEKDRITSGNSKERKELRDRKSKIIDQLNKRLVSNELKRHNYFREG